MPSHPLSLTGRLVMVTGASSGIGRETAILLSELGARTVLVARSHERLEATLRRLAGEGHRVEPCDLAALEEIPPWMKRITAETGPLHGLVHAAGIRSMLPLRMLPPQKFEEALRINVSAAAMLAKAFRQKGCGQPGGSLVLVSSVAGLVGDPGLAAYSASKSALLGLCRSLALELAPERIRVNCVAPGCVRTEMLEQMRQQMTPEQFAGLEALHPLGLGTPRDVAHAIAFLLADMSRWITGSTLVVDGGYTAH